VRLERRAREGIADGSIDVLFRRWKRPQVVAGRRYRTTAGLLDVVALDVLDATSITDRDARRAGYASAREAVGDLRGGPGDPVYRLVIRPTADPDPRDVLAGDADLTEDDVTAIDRRLDRLDRASPHGPWTASVLVTIAARPGVRAADLAASLGRERLSFKADVRKLKALGLTISLPLGYRLSPRGEAYLRTTTRPS
jgi:hypothetical protein